MQKKLIALAVAGVASTAAFAQSNVTIYGDLKPSFDMLSVQGENGDRNSVSSNNSNIGFKGEENLGNGLKAIFQIESGVGIGGSRSTDNASQNPQGGLLGGRNTFVGLKGGFGEVTIGRRDTAYKSVSGSYDPFGDTIGDYNNIIGSAFGTSALFDTRADSAINYISPKFAGFGVTASYGLMTDNATTAQDDNITSFAATYDVGGLNVLGSYEKRMGSAVGGTQNRDAWKLGAKYTFGPASVAALYEDISVVDSISTAEKSRKAWFLAGTYNMGAFDLLASYAKASADKGAAAASNGAKSLALGVRYNLSKRTNVSFIYADLNNGNYTGANTATGYSLNMKNNSLGANNTDVDGFSVRVQHKF